LRVFAPKPFTSGSSPASPAVGLLPSASRVMALGMDSVDTPHTPGAALRVPGSGPDALVGFESRLPVVEAADSLDLRPDEEVRDQERGKKHRSATVLTLGMSRWCPTCCNACAATCLHRRPSTSGHASPASWTREE
jgi:hypothetical protein